MKVDAKRDRMITKDGWILCPDCGSMKLLRLPPDGRVRGYVYCRHCKSEKFLNIDLSLSPEPEPHDP